jgi:hypothetical protein
MTLPHGFRNCCAVKCDLADRGQRTCGVGYATHCGLLLFVRPFVVVVPPPQSFESRSGKWTSSGSVVVVEDGSASGAAAAAGAEDALDGAVRTLRALMQQEQQRMLCDFDDHLDDAKADWTNKELEAKVLPTK